MVIDLAHRADVPFADINEQTTKKLASALAYGLPAVNPVDAWGGFADFESTFDTCLEALATDPDTAITLMFPGIVGFEDTVEPALERALLAGHDLVLLGERFRGADLAAATAVFSAMWGVGSIVGPPVAGP